MSYDNTLKLLSNSFNRFYVDYDNNYLTIQNTANNFNQDFSLLCKQDYIDSLSIFPLAQYEILLLLKNFIEEAHNRVNVSTINKVIVQYEAMKQYDLKDMIYDYVNACNTFIVLFKSPKVNSFEQQLKIAQPVINEWRRYMNAVNSFIDSIKELSKLLNQIANTI